MRSRNRLVFIIVICLMVAAAFTYFTRFADRGRRIVSQPREILPRGDLADFEKSTITIFSGADMEEATDSIMIHYRRRGSHGKTP